MYDLLSSFYKPCNLKYSPKNCPGFNELIQQYLTEVTSLEISNQYSIQSNVEHHDAHAKLCRVSLKSCLQLLWTEQISSKINCHYACQFYVQLCIVTFFVRFFCQHNTTPKIDDDALQNFQHFSDAVPMVPSITWRGKEGQFNKTTTCWYKHPKIRVH